MSSYFSYLCDLVKVNDAHYNKLLTYLHHEEFYSLVSNDENRIVDGEHLRKNFISEIGGPTGSLSSSQSKKYYSVIDEMMELNGCTLLEMMIGVAYRLEYQLLGSEYERKMADWFWVLIDNLELKSYTDDKIGISLDFLQEKIENLLTRRYDFDGTGGLFPLNSPKKDQRKVEIWYQMNAWTIENYPI